MKTIRNGVFETNSSSTHSICISKQDVDITSLPKSIKFELDDFGWAVEEVNRANYLYTAICSIDSSHLFDRESWIEFITETLAEFNIDVMFETPKYNSDYRYLQNGGIDHGHNLSDFLTALYNDKMKLLRYLFSDSHVYTGNDNEWYNDKTYSTFEVACEKMYNYDTEEYIDNPYHDSEKYEYFYKDN